MNILAFDTCLDKTYITLRNEKEILQSEIILSNNENYHSAYLISTIVSILKKANMTPQDINIIATDIGPGSFTGIRACTTVARVLAQQLNIKVVGVSSLEILANAIKKDCIVALNARKNKAYIYDNEIKGAIELEEVDELLKDKIVIADKSLMERFSQYAKTIYAYEEENYPLGDILAEITLKKDAINWSGLKPLYIQPPPVFGR